MTKVKRICAYRNRAEQLRILADSSLYRYERLTLRAIASTYDRLADDATKEPGLPTVALALPGP